MRLRFFVATHSARRGSSPLRACCSRNFLKNDCARRRTRFTCTADRYRFSFTAIATRRRWDCCRQSRALLSRIPDRPWSISMPAAAEWLDRLATRAITTTSRTPSASAGCCLRLARYRPAPSWLLRERHVASRLLISPASPPNTRPNCFVHFYQTNPVRIRLRYVASASRLRACRRIPRWAEIIVFRSAVAAF